MNRCISGKRIYVTRELAEDALIETRTKFEYAAGHGPVSVYQCEDCGQFHLTSRGPMNEKLAKAISEGQIQLQKEANRWLRKFKKR